MVLQATRWELQAAILLSEVAYSVQPHLDNDPVQRFRATFSVRGSLTFGCTTAGQKYVTAVVQRHTQTTLVCAFAGTHLPGDWERVNVQLHHATDAREVGAPGHTGFLQRALDVPMEGIERIARDAGATRVVLCGHSLGGAVSHFCLLRWLFGRRSNEQLFGKGSVVSIAIGAPFFGGQDMLDHVLRHDWSRCFINLVNGNDPVPRVMNLAAALVDSTISCSLDLLLSTCVAFLKKVNPTVSLAHNLVEAIKQSSQEDLVEWASYLPIGHYVVFPAEEKGTVLVSDTDTNYVTELLGPVHLLGEKPNFVNGFLDQSSLAHHEIKAYHNILEANFDEIGPLCAKEKTSNMPFPSALRLGANVEVPSAADLAPVVHEISCETFTSHEKQHCRIIKVSGRNLDFVGRNSIQLDVDNADTAWSHDCVIATHISRRSTADLVLEQTLRLNAPPRPTVDVQCQLRSDVVVDGAGVSTTRHTLYRMSCHSAESTPRNQHCCLYGGQFFLDSLQHAWITRQLFNDPTLERKMEELAMMVQYLGCVESESPDFLQLNPDWSTLEEVGHGESHAKRREELFQWLVPPDGLIVRTKLETRSSMAAIFLSIAVGGGIIATGGLGIVGGALGYGASLSGGYGTASLLASGGTLTYFWLRSRLRSEYCVLLEDLIKVYTGAIPKTRNEVELEDALLSSHDDYQTMRQKGNVRKMRKTNGIPCFDQYDGDSQKKFEERVKVIRYIHEIKRARNQGAFIVVCGPRDSGKTTLVSQLLHDPRLAATASGYRGGEEETTTVIPYQLADVPGAAILDSPGLTGVDVGTRDMFERCAMRLTTTFVYVRAYEGLPTEVDWQTVARILEYAADNQACKILICLNHCKLKLTQDAAGERFDLVARRLKREWLESLYSLQERCVLPTWINQILSRCTIVVEFVELNGDKHLEDSFARDQRTRGIWTASSIGEWIASSVGGDSNLLQEHMASFSYDEWRSGVHRERQRIREEQATELIDAFRGQ